jgi:RNA polymerase sigma factor (sigma-70 family)
LLDPWVTTLKSGYMHRNPPVAGVTLPPQGIAPVGWNPTLDRSTGSCHSFPAVLGGALGAGGSKGSVRRLASSYAMSPPVENALLASLSDARLIALTRGGNQRAFEVVVRRYSQPLLVYTRRIAPTTTAAEDAVQETFLHAYAAISRGTEVHDLKPWLYTIARNSAVNQRRRATDHAPLTETLVSADIVHAQVERQLAIRAALAAVAALPELQREALLHAAVAGQSYGETATVLGVSSASVRGLLCRARASLRAAAAAVSPMPIMEWATRATRRLGNVVDHLSGLGTAAGGAGLAGAIAKSGIVIATAGGLVFAGTTIDRSLNHRHARADRDREAIARVVMQPRPSPGRVELVSASRANVLSRPDLDRAAGSLRLPTARREPSRHDSDVVPQKVASPIAASGPASVPTPARPSRGASAGPPQPPSAGAPRSGTSGASHTSGAGSASATDGGGNGGDTGATDGSGPGAPAGTDGPTPVTGASGTSGGPVLSGPPPQDSSDSGDGSGTISGDSSGDANSGNATSSGD